MKLYHTDVLGQLMTRNTVENVIKRIINTEVIRYTTWSPASLQADALRNMAGIPLVSLIPVRVDDSLK